MVKLAFHEVAGQRLPVGVFFVGFPPGAAKWSKVLQHQIRVLVGFSGTIEGTDQA